MVGMQRSLSLPGSSKHAYDPKSQAEIPVWRGAIRNTVTSSARSAHLDHGEGPATLPKIETEWTPKYMSPSFQDSSAASGWDQSQVGGSVLPSSDMALEELAHLARLCAHQQQKESRMRSLVRRCLISTGLSGRLARCAGLAHRNLVESFRLDNKKAFRALHRAMLDIHDSCSLFRSSAVQDPIEEMLTGADNADPPHSTKTFMHELPHSARRTLLDFLEQIRNNPDFLATRIANLTQTELHALAASHAPLDASISVLPSGFHRSSASLRGGIDVHAAIERLLSFQRQDPLSALIYGCFADSAGPNSSEDRRRTDTWAHVCARLITGAKHGADPFICCILSIWADLREWSGRNRMDWYLMKILQDGSFLLEQAEDQAGTRIHVSPRSVEEVRAADDFYDSAVKGLFELLGDSDAGAIPEGMVELSSAIMQKLDIKQYAPARRFFVAKWLFSVFLLKVMMHPESYGLLATYHLTEYGRQKILKEVALRCQKIAVDHLWHNNATTALPVQNHIHAILERFGPTSSNKPMSTLVASRSITSLRETVEVQPFLVLCPTDLSTMINALYPERRPESSLWSRDPDSSSLRSVSSSIQAQSMVLSTRDGNLAASIASQASTCVAGSASDPANPTIGHKSSFASCATVSTASSTACTEHEAPELRAALTEISRVVGHDPRDSKTHPCAENWTVLFTFDQGQSLSIHAKHGDGEDGITLASAHQGNNEDNSRDSIRQPLLKLLAAYEIPLPDPESPTATHYFSNKPSFSLGDPGDKNITDIADTKHPHLDQPRRLDARAHYLGQSHAARKEDESRPSVLLHMLEAAVNDCTARSEFVDAHLYWQTVQRIRNLPASMRRDDHAALLNAFSTDTTRSISASTSACDELEAWMVWLRQSQGRHDASVSISMQRLQVLRDKMWYISDVRNSAPYERARNVTIALNGMATSTKASKVSLPLHRPKHVTRASSSSNYLHRTEAQVIEIISLPDHAGRRPKLSDEQVDKTTKWLAVAGIENFCKGEERIHRFCFEIDNCLNALTGDSLIDNPVLWSSELFHQDKLSFDRGRSAQDSLAGAIGHLGIHNEWANPTATFYQNARGYDFTRPTSRDVYAQRNQSQHSFDSGRYTMSRNSIDHNDHHDQFSLPSPGASGDLPQTFWPQIQQRTISPALSQRPSTAASVASGISIARSVTASHARQVFLSELRQSLTSLLLSDLGGLVFARGSETDVWFSGKLINDCLSSNTDPDRQSIRRSKKRVIEKKKSIVDLREANKTDAQSFERLPLGHALDQERRPRPATTPSQDPLSSTEEATSTHTENNSKGASGVGVFDSAADFPYRSAFARLLTMFSVQPSPFAKIDALFELQQLMTAYLRCSTRSSLFIAEADRSARHSDPARVSVRVADPLSNLENGPSGNSTLSNTISNCRTRRSQTISTAAMQMTGADAQTLHAGGPKSPADSLVEALQSLLRLMDIRPSTLFRDLQYVAAFVPATILDQTARGKAFWDFGLAALGLKQEICRNLVETADTIVAYHTSARAPPVTTPSERIIESTKETETHGVQRYTMHDAAQMLVITAREGDPTAMRELAIMYLTHPELVERTMAPLSRSRPLHGGNGGGSGADDGQRARGKQEGEAKEDPRVLECARHWMELSARGGDELAQKYMRQREEFGGVDA